MMFDTSLVLVKVYHAWIEMDDDTMTIVYNECTLVKEMHLLSFWCCGPLHYFNTASLTYSADFYPSLSPIT